MKGSTKVSEMPHLDAALETTEISQFITRTNHSRLQLSKSMPPTTNAEEVEVSWFYEEL